MTPVAFIQQLALIWLGKMRRLQWVNHLLESV